MSEMIGDSYKRAQAHRERQHAIGGNPHQTNSNILYRCFCDSCGRSTTHGIERELDDSPVLHCGKCGRRIPLPEGFGIE